ncbi:MAG: arsenate reductase ArsC [Moraxellaceae bacterium]|jgi:arsenate reductase|nr:arsenate reductase ArsC [Moraxellaceae bacterium]MDF3029716.1 arsenate reductase ArsC [Moraxellaceae bacterium]
MDKTYNLLFLCTGNSARSIMAEGLLNVLGRGRFRAFSAGSQPTGRVNPFALEILQDIGYDVRDLRSKSWDVFADAAAPHMDFIITVCDNAAGEVCPVWPGHPAVAHWGFEDPAAVQGTDDEKRAAFQQVCQQIRHRIQLFLALPLDTLDPPALLRHLREIGAQ